VDDELHPAANSTAPIPAIAPTTLANLSIVLGLSVIVGIADTVPTDPFAPGEPTPRGLVWIGFR
jgi:hypothetical protein